MLIVEIMLLLIDASRTYSCVRTAVSICQIPVKDSGKGLLNRMSA